MVDSYNCKNFEIVLPHGHGFPIRLSTVQSPSLRPKWHFHGKQIRRPWRGTANQAQSEFNKFLESPNSQPTKPMFSRGVYHPSKCREIYHRWMVLVWVLVPPPTKKKSFYILACGGSWNLWLKGVGDPTKKSSKLAERLFFSCEVGPREN